MSIVNNPITLNPPIKGYQGYAFPLSILFSKDNKFQAWLYSKLIMIVGAKDFSRFEPLQKDWMFINEGVFNYHYCKFPKKILLSNPDSLINIIIEMISCSNYVVGLFNEFYVPHRYSYKVNDYDHDYCITGYNNSEMIFYIIGYTDKGLFEKTEIKIFDYIDALKNIINDDISLTFLTINESFVPNFNIQECKNTINNYINSNDDGLTSYGTPYDPETYLFGINAVENLSNYVDFVREKNRPIDKRYFFFLWEHKKLMYKRIEYLLQNRYLTEDTSFLKDYNNIVIDADIIKNLVLKYNLMPNDNIPKKIKNRIIKNVNCEKEILSNLINKLR